MFNVPAAVLFHTGEVAAPASNCPSPVLLPNAERFAPMARSDIANPGRCFAKFRNLSSPYRSNAHSVTSRRCCAQTRQDTTHWIRYLLRYLKYYSLTFSFASAMFHLFSVGTKQRLAAKRHPPSPRGFGGHRMMTISFVGAALRREGRSKRQGELVAA